MHKLLIFINYFKSLYNLKPVTYALKGVLARGEFTCRDREERWTFYRWSRRLRHRRMAGNIKHGFHSSEKKKNFRFLFYIGDMHIFTVLEYTSVWFEYNSLEYTGRLKAKIIKSLFANSDNYPGNSYSHPWEFCVPDVHISHLYAVIYVFVILRNAHAHLYTAIINKWVLD